MKKLLMVLLGVFLMLSVTACSKEDPKELYKTARDNMANVKSATYDMNLTLNMTDGGTTIEMPVDIYTITDGDNSYMKLSAEIFGSNFETEEWVIDGKSYNIANGEYYIEDTDGYEVGSELLDIYEYVQSAEMVKDGDDRVIRLTLDPALLGEVYGQLGLLDELTGDDDMIENLSMEPVEVRISKDNYVTEEKLTMTYVAEEGECTVTITIKASGINSSFVTEPDYDEFDRAMNSGSGLGEFTGGYVPDYDIDRDITMDDQAILEGIGFEYLGDSVFLYDDVLYLDAEYKWIYYVVDDNRYYYDWELDLGSDDLYDKYYFFDAEYGDSSENCDDWDKDFFVQLKELFNTLYDEVESAR